MNLDDDTLEARLRKKLDLGEISQEEFNELFQKFQDLGLLDAKTPPKKRKRNWIFNGYKVFDNSARTDGPVIINGSLNVHGDLECQKLNTAGYLKVSENLIVKDKATVSGRLDVKGEMKIGESMIIAGRLNVEGNAVCPGSIKISGKAQVSGDIVCGETLKIGGNVIAKNILCTGTTKLIGSIEVQDNLVSEKFQSELGGYSKIGGDLKARIIKVGNPILNDIKFVANGIDMSHLINSVISSFMPAKKKSVLVVENIEGENVEIDQVHVKGDVICRNGKFGSNVKIGGMIYYSESISLPDGLQIASKKV